MNGFIEQYPIIATIAGFFLAVMAGAIDLVVLRNRALAILFWVLGLPLTITPIVSKVSWGDFRWLLAILVAALYVGTVLWIYRTLAPGKHEEAAEEDSA